MIELTPLARPYAKALFASALESKNIDEMASELKTMALASKTDGVINTIENPVLSRQDVVTVLVDLFDESISCLLYTSPSPRDRQKSRMPSSA